jgi:hypothetical protein
MQARPRAEVDHISSFWTQGVTTTVTSSTSTELGSAATVGDGDEERYGRLGGGSSVAGIREGCHSNRITSGLTLLHEARAKV